MIQKITHLFGPHEAGAANLSSKNLLLGFFWLFSKREPDRAPADPDYSPYTELSPPGFPNDGPPLFVSGREMSVPLGAR